MITTVFVDVTHHGHHFFPHPALSPIIYQGKRNLPLL